MPLLSRAWILACLLICILTSTGAKEEKKDEKDDGDVEIPPQPQRPPIMGTEEEVKRFLELSEQEVQERLKLALDVVDADHDGKFTVEELTNSVKKTLENSIEQETGIKMNADDVDKDRLITWDEYVEAAFGMSQEDLTEYIDNELDEPDAIATMQKNLGFAKKRFTAADLDKDGKLNFTEYAAFLHPYDFDHMAAVELERVMNEVDKDKSGTVSMEEHKANKTYEENADEKQDEESFQFHDKNKDGILDQEEMFKWVSPGLTSVASNEAKFLMNETDTNADSSLSMKEILDKFKLWVGSGVTNYGQMITEADKKLRAQKKDSKPKKDEF